ARESRELCSGRRSSPGGVVLLALLRLHSGSHQVDRVTAEHDTADGVYPIANLIERYKDGISLLDGPHPVRGIDQCAADKLAIEVDVGKPHLLTARSAVGIIALPVGEECLDAGKVQARDNSPPLPSLFSPELAEGLAGGLVGTLHLRVAVVEHEHLR